ncbi:hypothetical protein X736_31195 [Mesorhizobium sp. L2C089B000]|nr:hypothetical protein X736_31195 [Mesorhizobium sp. L2C089B000]
MVRGKSAASALMRSCAGSSSSERSAGALHAVVDLLRHGKRDIDHCRRHRLQQ